METNLQVGLSLIQTSDLIDLVVEKKELENALLDSKKELNELKNIYKKITDKYLDDLSVEDRCAENPENYFYSWEFRKAITDGIPYEALEKYVEQKRIVEEQENDD